MTNQSSIDPARTAVLSMDLQAGIISIYAKDDASFVERAASILGKARELGMYVIHVQVGFRKKLPEVSSRNALFAAIKNSERHQRLFEGDLGAIHPMLGPAGDDIVVVKHRVSAFAGTDLEMILRANEIDTLVLFGIATSGVVLSTLVDAVDLDYRLFVVKDCCLDSDAELNTALVERFFPLRGKVISAGEFLAGSF
jgi:nicotinamidase-related amidase